jgi:26S proteasome regulatory subunit N2
MSVAGPVPMSGVPLGSAAGLLSMLEEEQTQLQVAALTNLNKVIDTHWAEVASSISVIEAMYEDEFFAQRELAALLASKVRRAPDARDLPPDGAFPRGLAVCPQKQDLRSVPLDTSAQVFYHLGELDDALNYALCAGSLFDVNETTDFVQTMLSTSPRAPPRASRPVVPRRSVLFWHIHEKRR